MNYEIIRLSDRPELAGQCALWFSEKWGIPLSAYEESMAQCIAQKSPVPQWYVALEGDRIIGGMGVIENDFHSRKDLAPNVCAVYVEPNMRRRGIARALLDFVCRDMKEKGIGTLYLVTGHTSLYERYGWEFFCEAECGEQELTRVYIHKS